MRSVSIEKPIWTERTVLIPDVCSCGADLKAPNSIREWNWTTTSFDCSIADAGRVDVGTGDEVGGDDFHMFAYDCIACGISLTDRSYVFEGSHGKLVADESGYVTSAEPEGCYPEVHKFDISDYENWRSCLPDNDKPRLARTEDDILAVGYTTKEQEYVPPDMNIRNHHKAVANGEPSPMFKENR